MRNVTVRQLQVFVEAAELLSLARVAERLHLTPSAVSFQIKQIELQTGFALFERTGRKVALTDAGVLLLGYGRHVLRSLDDADQAMMGLRGLTGGRVRLGLVSTSKYIVPHIIARFRDAFPGVTVQLTEGNRSRVLGMLTGGMVDLAVMGQPPDDADVIAERFAPHPSVIIAAASHRLGAAPGLGRAALAPGVLADEPFVVREDGSGTKALADKFFGAIGLTPRVTMVSSSNEMIKQAVIAGMGLALISQHTVSLELALGLLITLPVEGFPLMRSWYIVQRRTLPLLPVQARLRSFLIEVGQHVIEDIAREHARIGSVARRPADAA
jgi:LysR family transcriptional regulator, low CO2-responsive transcriptional regulator